MCSSMDSTNDFSPDFPSNLNVPNLPCLINDTRPISPHALQLPQVFAPSQSLVNIVPKLPSSVTVTPQLAEPINESNQNDNRGTSASGNRRSSIKLPGKTYLHTFS